MFNLNVSHFDHLFQFIYAVVIWYAYTFNFDVTLLTLYLHAEALIAPMHHYEFLAREV